MVQFSSFSVLDREFRDCFVSKAYQRNTSEIPAKFLREAEPAKYQQKFLDQLFKGHFVEHLF